MMNDQLQKEKKKILTLRVKNIIEAGEWQKLIAALPVAEEAEIDRKLLLKSYLLLGDHFINEKLSLFITSILEEIHEVSYLKLHSVNSIFSDSKLISDF